MEKNSGLTWRPDKNEKEMAWFAEFLRHEANGEFRRARRRAIQRLLFGGLANRNGRDAAAGSFAGIRTRDGLVVPIDSIVGMIDRNGKEAAGLPPISRKLAGEWQRGFSLDFDDAYPALSVRPGSGGWYLMGGTTALILLEIMRAKKWRTLRVTPMPEREKRIRQGSEEMADGCECGAEYPRVAC